MDYIVVQGMMNNSKSYYFFQGKSGQSIKLHYHQNVVSVSTKKVNNIWKRNKIPAIVNGLR